MNSGGSTDARARYTGFHWGRRPSRAIRVKTSPRPRELVEIGKLEAVTYSTMKGDEGLQHYEHMFADKGGRKPRLAFDPKTDRLHIVGGGYKVEDRGIVD